MSNELKRLDEYLADLEKQRERLITTLTELGIDAGGLDTFNELIDKKIMALTEAFALTTAAQLAAEQTGQFAELAASSSQASAQSAQTAVTALEAIRHDSNKTKELAENASAKSDKAEEVAQKILNKANSGEFNGRDGVDGENGTVFPVTGFFSLTIDSFGNLWLRTADEGQSPLHYDSASGNLFYKI